MATSSGGHGVARQRRLQSIAVAIFATSNLSECRRPLCTASIVAPVYCGPYCTAVLTTLLITVKTTVIASI